MGGILNDKERAYLSSVIKPFRDKEIVITKFAYDSYEYIEIAFRDIDGKKRYMWFPPFKKGTMYKDMETGKAYSLNELEL